MHIYTLNYTVKKQSTILTMAAHKESNIYDKPEAQEKSDTYIKSTAIKKSHGRCSCTSIVKYLAAIVVSSIAIAAFVMGVVSLNNNPLTEKDISFVTEFNEFNNTLASFSKDLADLELNIEDLHAEFRDSSENKTMNAILQLSIQFNTSREQIEQLYQVIGEILEQQNSTQSQVDELVLNFYELKQRQNQTEQQIRVNIDNLKNFVENRFDEIENSTLSKSELHGVETKLSTLESRVDEIDNVLSSGVILMSKYSLAVGLVTMLCVYL